ncbi:hypothetical protein RHIZ404_220003 [Rhizobium sp. EC-SD404]|nr:hypothetical protein RHIZ404_220003 [Rhizobium sp. EC-SD404]
MDRLIDRAAVVAKPFPEAGSSALSRVALISRGSVDSYRPDRHNPPRFDGASLRGDRRSTGHLPSGVPAKFGEVPERLKGADCKSVGLAYAGSNPALSTTSPDDCPRV